ncbi:hypothetical protein ALI22I_01865 [Saccharothrix sp. ALI-22-I]|uniref:hypothetical protein n=1 Tax=Saccharothrix sp. ALI-22-I TaxID=1933778 RepID=UPI00097CBC2A|nr:hypothetical protein [Saccharothrix sp. ALI-22-I]ONI92797.1 hypothetical protein ALI22I_01865 [Saccharothrix sp. ALI-22-I]
MLIRHSPPRRPERGEPVIAVGTEPCGDVDASPIRMRAVSRSPSTAAVDSSDPYTDRHSAPQYSSGLHDGGGVDDQTLRGVGVTGAVQHDRQAGLREDVADVVGGLQGKLNDAAEITTLPTRGASQ